MVFWRKFSKSWLLDFKRHFKYEYFTEQKWYNSSNDLNYIFNFIVKYNKILNIMFCISFHEYYAEYHRCINQYYIV